MLEVSGQKGLHGFTPGVQLQPVDVPDHLQATMLRV